MISIVVNVFIFLAVRPDPPVSLNWTLQSISPSGLSYDVMVNWEPPPSADVKAGWMRIEYEIQYRERNTTNWKAVSLQFPPSFSFSFMCRHTVTHADTCKHTPLKLHKMSLCTCTSSHKCKHSCTLFKVNCR